jgi:hypothetical protein
LAGLTKGHLTANLAVEKEWVKQSANHSHSVGVTHEKGLAARGSRTDPSVLAERSAAAGPARGVHARAGPATSLEVLK